MNFNKYKTYVIAFFSVVFFTFSGYYAVLMICNNLVGVQYSRFFTVPVRILIVLLLIITLKLIGKKQHINQSVLLAFFAFSFIYILRIISEILNNNVNRYSNETFLFYFITFSFLPFLFLFIKKEYSIDKIIYKNAILISGLILSIVTFYFYKDLIGTVGRISLALDKDENYISPLALSYSGSMSMGIGLCLLLTTVTTKKYKIFLLAVILLASIPFFLGASRGSVLAIIIPFILFILNQKNKKNSFYLFIILIGLSFGVVILSEYFGSSVIDRFLNIGSAVSSGSTSAIRTVYWQIALNNFADNPIFGYRIMSPEIGIYPHNIIIEVLLTTGVVGSIPFFFLIFKAFKESFFIFKYSPEDSWIAFIFMQAFIQYMFSGAIYSASWLWISLAFILSVNFKNNYLNKMAEQPKTLTAALK